MTQKTIAQGAEAKIILSVDSRAGGRDSHIIKDRIKKSYRIPELDKQIRKKRTKAETKLLIKASKIINTPTPEDSREFDKIKMPFIDGKKLSKHLDNFPIEKQKQILNQIGKDIAKLHDENIIHGDLTTSNMILVSPSSGGRVGTSKDKIYFIDFGLGYISQKFEDKAVDIHLLKQALEAKHFKHFETLFNEFLNGYKTSKQSQKTLNQLIKVEKRGRYKH